MKPSHLVLVALLAGPVVKSQVPTKPEVEKPVKQKVLFLTNSTFHAHGGCMAPFNGYCDAAGVHYDASGSYRHLQSTPKGRRISPFLAGQVKDSRILDLIEKGHFDYVVLVTRSMALAADTRAKDEIAAFKKMHEHIVRSGARTVVSISYITRNSTHNTDRKTRNLAKHEELKAALDSMEIEGKKHPIILAPTGLLWAEGVDRFGVNAWFADAVHGTPLAQHASGCLFFTFITGKDPRENAHVALHAEARFPDKKLSSKQAEWLRERVWALYQQRVEKERSSDISFAKSTFEALCRGDRSAEEAIDFEVLSSFGTDVGQTYRPFSEAGRESFRKAFVSQFAISFREEGASADRFTNWRVESEDSARMVAACDAPSGAVMMITVSKSEGHRKISSMAFQ